MIYPYDKKECDKLIAMIGECKRRAMKLNLFGTYKELDGAENKVGWEVAERVPAKANRALLLKKG